MPNSVFLMSVNKEQGMYSTVKKTLMPQVTIQSNFNEVLLIMNIMGTSLWAVNKQLTMPSVLQLWVSTDLITTKYCP